MKNWFWTKVPGVLRQTDGQHVREKPGHDRRPQHIVESLEALFHQVGIDIEEKVVNVLHRQLEVVQAKLVREDRFIVERLRIHRISRHCHGLAGDQSGRSYQGRASTRVDVTKNLFASDFHASPFPFRFACSLFSTIAHNGQDSHSEFQYMRASVGAALRRGA